MRCLAACGFFVIFPFLAIAQNPCSLSELQSSVSSLKAVQSKLLTVKVTDGGMNPEVSPELQENIHKMKDALANVSEQFAFCQNTNPLDVKDWQSRLAELIGANQPTRTGHSSPPQPQEDMNDHIYGDGLSVEVRQPASFPNLVVVKLAYGIVCGEDNVLLVYEKSGTQWKSALRWQSGEFATSADAFGDYYQYAILPFSKSRPWVLGVFHGSPWCTSRESSFSVGVIAPGQNSRAEILFLQRHLYSRTDGPVFKTTATGMEIRAQVDSLDFEKIMTRMAIFRYKVTPAAIRRIQPVALNGRDFVDEWLQTDWVIARNWSSKNHLTELREMQRKLIGKRNSASGDYVQFSYGPVRACKSGTKQFQVELNLNPGKPVYFQIAEGTHSFTMMSVSEIPRGDCSGPDLMRKN